ncbi:hypothetical protein [Spirosoma flavum]|uniref:Transposase n=1 Tax=Spirosoma flavum TaxID=2048557 RepID=A0ABW6AKP3_9BACT
MCILITISNTEVKSTPPPLGFSRFVYAEAAVEQAIAPYNSVPAHALLGYQTAPAARAESGTPAGRSS